MYSKQRVLFIVIFIPCVAGILNHNYGPYRTSYRKYELCKGPKKLDCGNIEIDTSRNMSNVLYSLDFSKSCPVTKAKVAMGTVNNKSNKTNKLVNYQLNKPCQHFVLGPILKKAFNLSENCIVSQGHYEVPINMHEINANFLGTSFFYDTYFFKIMAYNDRSNFICIYCVMDVFPV